MTGPLSTEQALYKMLHDGLQVYDFYSGVKVAQISAASYSPSYPVDLGAIYDVIRVFCEDASYIPSATYLEMEVCVSYPTYDMMALYETDDPGVQWCPSSFLPTSGGFDFVLASARSTRWLLPSLTNPATGAVLLYIYGVHKSQ